MRYAHVRIFAGCALALLLVLAGCDSSNPMSETQPADAPTVEETGTAVPGQYIVVLKDNAVTAKSDAAVRAVAQTLLGKSNTISNAYSTALTGFTATNVTPQQLEGIQNDPRVDYVEQDQVVTLGPPCFVTNSCNDGGGGGDAQVTPYGVTRVGGPVDGTGKTAWVIDTGVDLDHPDLNVDTNLSADFSGKGSADDGDGHGTHVAGTIAAIDNDIDVVGVAAGATIVGVKVLDDNGSGTYADVIDGIDYVAANASAGDVANLSLGGGTSTSVDDAVKNAADQGVFMAIAAGNSGADANNYSPARTEYANVFTISAFDDTDAFASFSNYSGPSNPPIEFGAPGVDVKSLYANGGVQTLSGTSMASPHGAGILLINGGSFNTDGTVSGDPDGDPDPVATL